MANGQEWKLSLRGTLRMESIFQSQTFQTNTATHTGKCPSHTEEEEDKDHLAGCHYKNLNEADNRKLSTNTPVMVCMGPCHSNPLTISPRQNRTKNQEKSWWPKKATSHVDCTLESPESFKQPHTLKMHIRPAPQTKGNHYFWKGPSGLSI